MSMLIFSLQDLPKEKQFMVGKVHRAVSFFCAHQTPVTKHSLLLSHPLFQRGEDAARVDDFE